MTDAAGWERPAGAAEPGPAPADQVIGPLLEVTDLRTHFLTPHGAVRVVDGVSLTLHAGRTLGIVGESGSGKTALSRTIMGLHPGNAVTTGRVRFAGADLLTLSPRRWRDVRGNRIALVPQDPMTALNPVVRIGRQITESLRAHRGMDRNAAGRRAIELLEAVEIPGAQRRLRQYPHELSGGMRQRVCIAIALACDPELIIADEPTTALDVTVQAQILDLLQAQQRERGMAMILVTHDLGVVAGRADDIAVMYAGKIVEHAPATRLFPHRRMRYTDALLAAMPDLTKPSHSRLGAIPGRPPNLIAPPSGCSFHPRCAQASQRCIDAEPELIGDAPGHAYACWHPRGLDDVVPTRASEEQG